MYIILKFGSESIQSFLKEKTETSENFYTYIPLHNSITKYIKLINAIFIFALDETSVDRVIG